MPFTIEDNAALFWNEVFLDAALADSLKPPNQQEQGGPTRTSRAGAIVHAALHNAVNGVRQLNAFYRDPRNGQPAPPGPPPPSAAAEAAAAGAAHRALSQLYPSQVANLFNPELARFRTLPLPGANHQPSIDYGATVAGQLLAARANDGSQNPDPPYSQPSNPGVWQPDPVLAPPNPPLGVGWGRVRPFLLRSSSQVRPPAPPALTSGDYTFAFRNVFDKGRNNSPPPPPPIGRTADEQHIAIFWSYDDKLGTPIRLYNQHAFQILNQEPNPPTVGSILHRHARLFALINLAMADAGIACWESKYRYNYWRPFQGIRQAHRDGNPNTTRDQNWLPLGRPRATDAAGNPVPNTTPNFPAYVSGHSSFGAAMFGMLRKFFGPLRASDPPRVFPFTLSSEEISGTRSYSDRMDPNGRIVTSWTQVINENSESRIFLGVHWRRDHTVGTPLGQKVADYIWPSFLRPTT